MKHITTTALTTLAAISMAVFGGSAWAATRVESVDALPVLVLRDGQPHQLLRLNVRHDGAALNAVARVADGPTATVLLKPGKQQVEVLAPAAETPTAAMVKLTASGKTLVSRPVTLKPVRKWTVYVLPHSHVDIGYTQLQTEVERKQWRNIDLALDLIVKTRGNPPGARFKWNAEVLWAVDSYLKQAPAEKQRRLIEAIRRGDFELDALYGNELTGLCRPEELLRLCGCAQLLAKRCGVKVDVAMISDVPGYTWGIVPALAEAGVKYFSIGPNYCERIGRTMTTWEDKPFYWLAPDGRHKVLCWIPYMGYALGHTGYRLDRRVPEHLAQLEAKGYPYNVAQLRWTVGGDNGHPDAGLPDLVKSWNASHIAPKMVIATTSEMMREFEKRYGDKIPTVSGDFTPYWEDGAASSARETALNRTAAERLVQAETLWAMLRPAGYPVESFDQAWRNVVLYDEHTWGAHNSVSQPDLAFVKDIWKIKQTFALDGDTQSKKLLVAASAGVESARAAVDVFNTNSWPRTDLVVLTKEQSTGGVVTDQDGRRVPSQRLSTGELAFLAQNVPPLAGRRYLLGPLTGKTLANGSARAEGTTLRSPAVTVQVDPASGAIVSLRSAAIDVELCDMKSGVGLNRYYYVLGNKAGEAQQAGPAKITVKEAGPLVASLAVESDAPGCAKFTREYRVIDGLDRLDIIDTLDKIAVRKKEGVHLVFAFHVPDGTMRIDIPWAVIRPELDQLPGACKNWLCVSRWADISNADYGVTWATLDAPLVEVGAITADKISSQTSPNVWLDKLAPSQTLYSWVMNNHWHTNYRADQSGLTTFRYALQPHKRYDSAAAARFGIEQSQPLVATPARGAAPSGRPLLTLDTPNVIVTALKPSRDGKAWIIRLFGASGRESEVRLRWDGGAPKAVAMSNLAEDCLEDVHGPVAVPAWSIVTLRAERAGTNE